MEQNPESDKDLASFQDGYPYLTLGEDSLDDINSKIPGKNYTVKTFRPNIVIKSIDNKPWAEVTFLIFTTDIISYIQMNRITGKEY